MHLLSISWPWTSPRPPTVVTLCDTSKRRKWQEQRRRGRKKYPGGAYPILPPPNICYQERHFGESPRPARHKKRREKKRSVSSGASALCCRFEAKRRWETKSNMGFMWQRVEEKTPADWQSGHLYLKVVWNFNKGGNRCLSPHCTFLRLQQQRKKGGGGGRGGVVVHSWLTRSQYRERKRGKNDGAFKLIPKAPIGICFVLFFITFRWFWAFWPFSFLSSSLPHASPLSLFLQIKSGVHYWMMRLFIAVKWVNHGGGPFFSRARERKD